MWMETHVSYSTASSNRTAILKKTVEINLGATDGTSWRYEDHAREHSKYLLMQMARLDQTQAASMNKPESWEDTMPASKPIDEEGIKAMCIKPRNLGHDSLPHECQSLSQRGINLHP